jgi:hypothetical protein
MTEVVIVVICIDTGTVTGVGVVAGVDGVWSLMEPHNGAPFL